MGVAFLIVNGFNPSSGRGRWCFSRGDFYCITARDNKGTFELRDLAYDYFARD